MIITIDIQKHQFKRDSITLIKVLGIPVYKKTVTGIRKKHPSLPLETQNEIDE